MLIALLFVTQSDISEIFVLGKRLTYIMLEEILVTILSPLSHKEFEFEKIREGGWWILKPIETNNQKKHSKDILLIFW